VSSLVAFRQTVRANILGTFWHFDSRRGYLARETRPSLTCVSIAKFCGSGSADPLETCLSPTCVTVSNLVVLRQTVWVYVWVYVSVYVWVYLRRSSDKFGPSCIAFWLFKVTQSHQNLHGSIGYLRLPISSQWLRIKLSKSFTHQSSDMICASRGFKSRELGGRCSFSVICGHFAWWATRAASAELHASRWICRSVWQWLQSSK